MAVPIDEAAYDRVGARDPLSLFDSAWLKWAWADIQAKTLNTDVVALFHHLQPLRTLQEYDPKIHGFRVRLNTHTQLPKRFALQTGDIFGNLKSALDHLAWALVARGTTPPDKLKPGQRNQVKFPIARTPAEFRKLARDSLPGARRADVAVARRHQPYADGQRQVSGHVLTLLKRYRDADTHQLIQVSAPAPLGATFRRIETRDCVVTRVRTFPIQALELGTELARVYVRRTGPNPDIAVEIDTTIQIALPDGSPLDGTVTGASRRVARVLCEFSEPPRGFFAQLGYGDWTCRGDWRPTHWKERGYTI